MHYDTHVFLGPSLDKATARHYLWQAHYHPPIQCGDLVRLLRCAPKTIVIIDGLYEQVPAVWHKEIMLALEQGINVYGAASMGALRAAELYRYGMIGIGRIFQAFASNQLNDDDEVAVLHQDVAQELRPINDAMVNIRATLEQALCEQIIEQQTHDALIAYCKSQFYPKRSLHKAIAQVSLLHQQSCARLKSWLMEHGLIDLKRQDAIAALTQVQQALIHKKLPNKTNTLLMPYTKFLASMVDEVVASPFSVNHTWLPSKEQKLAALAQIKPKQYQLVAELARLLQYAMAVVDLDNPLDHQHYRSYIAEHQLYYPRTMYNFLQQHDYLAPLATWMLHYICLAHITEQQIQRSLPAALFYFNEPLPKDVSTIAPLWSCIVLLLFLLQQQLNDSRLQIKKTVLNEHLREISFWRRYRHQQQYCESTNGLNLVADVKLILDFVLTYMKVIYIHHGTKDFKLGLASAPDYYHWIYDAMALQEAVDCELLQGCAV